MSYNYIIYIYKLMMLSVYVCSAFKPGVHNADRREGRPVTAILVSTIHLQLKFLKTELARKALPMHATDPVLIIDDDALIITGAEPEVAFRPYTRRQLLAICRKAYLSCSQLPYNQQNYLTQEHIFSCWQYLKNGYRFAILTEDPGTGAGVDDDDHLCVSILTSTTQEMQRDQLVRYELFFIPNKETLTRSKGNPDAQA